MRITETGILNQAEAGSARACLIYATITPLSDGTLVATSRAGDSKDCDNEVIEFQRSTDAGRTWSAPSTPFATATVDGHAGTLKHCYLTELSPGHVLAAAMWVDRTSHPGKPLFDTETEGCLPMAILLAESHDHGHSWGDWRQVPMPDDIGPPSLTSPIMKLADGTLAMSIETNKPYDDASKWMQRAVFLHSRDMGASWSAPVVAAQDPSARIYNWDMRCCVAPDGRIASFAWTYDTKTARYLNLHRRISRDMGQTWTDPEDLGFADQAGPPAVLADGRVVLAWVDRFGSQSIRARVAPAIDAPFDPDSEVTVYAHADANNNATGDTGELLGEMALWSFGLPYACALPDGDVLVAWYAGDADTMGLHWARLQL
jgi:hypothetical protein